MPKSSRASLTGSTLKTGRPVVFGKTPASDAQIRAALVKRENPVPPEPRRPSLKQETPGPHPAMRSTPRWTSSRLPWNEGINGMCASQIVDLLTARSITETFGKKREPKVPALDAATLLNLSNNGFSHHDTEFDRTEEGPDPSLRWSNFTDPEGNLLTVEQGRSNRWTFSNPVGKPLHGGKDLHSLTRFLLGDRQTYKMK